LFDVGTIVVATSNRPPDRLYEEGLQRERFLPFIALLQRRLDQLELDSGRDYRLSRMMGKRVYHWPLDLAAHLALEAAFAELTDAISPAGDGAWEFQRTQSRLREMQSEDSIANRATP